MRLEYAKQKTILFLSYLVQFHVYTMQLVSVLTELNYEHHSLNTHVVFHSLGFYALWSFMKTLIAREDIFDLHLQKITWVACSFNLYPLNKLVSSFLLINKYYVFVINDHSVVIVLDYKSVY